MSWACLVGRRLGWFSFKGGVSPQSSERLLTSPKHHFQSPANSPKISAWLSRPSGSHQGAAAGAGGSSTARWGVAPGTALGSMTVAGCLSPRVPFCTPISVPLCVNEMSHFIFKWQW